MTKVLTAATLYDFSDELLVPVRDYGIFSLPRLTEAHLLDLFDAIFSGVGSLLQANQSVDGLFAILATVLNFGQQLSDVASLYTGVHECVLERLATSVTSVMQLLSQRLFAPIASSIQQDGFIFADEVAMHSVVAETRKFLNNCAAYHLGAEIVQVIVVETCKACDARIFNIIIEASDVFTTEKMTQALRNVRRLQDAFTCVSRNFDDAFAHLAGLITKTQALWAGERGIPRTPLMRAIMERCRPQIVLPDGLTLDDIGEVRPRTELRVDEPEFGFVFRFEWLWLQGGAIIS
jgi:hypothetical protein